MKKIFLYSIALLIVLLQIAPLATAKSSGIGGPMSIAIKKYKRGNYTGCLQDCQAITRKTPSNALAYYYMAMSYVQAGRRDEAINAYGRVLSLKTTAKLFEYASTGKRCLETPDQCRLDVNMATSTTPEMDSLIASPVRGALSESVKADFTQKKLNALKNQINNGKDLDDYYFRKFKDYSNQRSNAETSDKIAQAQPTQDEIAAAMKVLNDAGINPYTQSQPATASMPQSTDNNDLAQINALMGGQTKGNDALNMIPYMMAQNKNGASNYTPQMMQALILNSMMTDFNFNLNNKDDN